MENVFYRKIPKPKSIWLNAKTKYVENLLLKDFQKIDWYKHVGLDLLNELLATDKPYNMDNITIFLFNIFVVLIAMIY